jgi:hypothetical protein
MLGLDLVRPLEEDWRASLDAVAHRYGWPTTHDVARLGGAVARLADAYNDPSRAAAAMRDAGAARLGFAFARDVPKAAAATRELLATGVLRLDGSLRVLDVGAGLGAMTWGVVRALEAMGAHGAVDAVWIERDALARDVGLSLAATRSQGGPIALNVRDTVASLDALPRGPFDLVLMGNVLSEMEVAKEAGHRAMAHATLLQSLLGGFVAPSGSLVAVEPALRDRARHLHRVRDLLAQNGATIFAPCLHEGACPALAQQGDWCHEDLPVDLPPWLVPVARAAGLRRQGLTFSYVVVRRDGLRLVDRIARTNDGARLRVVSDLIRTKGKVEAFLCGELEVAGRPSPARVRLRRLDRDENEENRAFARSRKGEVVVVQPAPERGCERVHAQTRVSPAFVLDEFVDRPGARG